MKAAVYRAFKEPLIIGQVADPTPRDDGVVLSVAATGVCRSDWHGWMGHDADVVPPHVPGHEIAGVVAAVGKDINYWKIGDRVTLPFVCGCGSCSQCQSGNQQVCDRQFQPGFTHWGSYAEFVAIHYADANLVRIPESMDLVTAASLGCRFATAFRAVAVRGEVSQDQWVAVFGCGGVGLSSIMIAAALGARVIAVDINDSTLEMATAVGAKTTINARLQQPVPEAIRECTGGGVQVSIDALGSGTTCFDSVASLSKRGKHVQVGLLTGSQRHSALPMDLVVARELEIVGSHGMQAHQYDRMLEMIATGALQPEKLIGRTINLETAVQKFTEEPVYESPGITVIDEI